jgi:hypothetical protein
MGAALEVFERKGELCCKLNAFFVPSISQSFR